MLNLSSASSNDAFASAQTLDGDAPLVTANNAVATSESGEPTHAVGARGQSLWYTWTAPQSGPTQVAAYSEAMDPVVAVYTGTHVGQLSLVASANDSGPDNINPTATAAFTATAGITYHIAVDRIGTDSGEFTLTITNALWQFTTGSIYDEIPTVTNSPAVGRDGTAYVASSDGFIYAVNPDGTQKWRFELGGYMDSSAVALGPDGTVYIGDLIGLAYTLDAEGNLVWVSDIADGSYTAPPALGADGTAYFKNDDGNLDAFAPDGTLRWSYTTTGDESYSGPTIAPDGTIYLPGNDGAIHAVSGSGAQIWRTVPSTSAGSDTSGIYTSPSLDAAGNIYAATLNGTVFSLTSSGALRWSFRTPGTGENVTSSLALADGRAYFASYGALLYAVDQTDGHIIWTRSIEAQARASSPAVASDGSIFIGSYANKLFRFSPDGELLRSWSAGNWFRSSPVLANGRLYIGNGDGKLYAFDVDGLGPAHADRSPWPQHRYSPARNARPTPDVTGYVYATDATDPGRLVNLSVRNTTRTGEGALIAGFVLGGSQSKDLVVRGIGPSLANFGVTDAVSGTTLQLYGSADSNTPLATNQGWTATTGDGSTVGAFGLSAGSADSVLRPTLLPGAFTARVTPSQTDASGTALLEIYDAALAQIDPPIINLSARTAVADGGDVIAGFVIGGTTPRSVLIRAVGPGLASFGVAGPLADPNLTLFSGSTTVFANDDWAGSPLLTALAKSAGAFPLESTNADAVLTATLLPGAYTARVTAPAGDSGVVLIEVYLLP